VERRNRQSHGVSRGEPTLYYLELEYTAGGNLADWLRKQEVGGQRLEAREKQEAKPGDLGALAVPLSLRLEIVAEYTKTESGDQNRHPHIAGDNSGFC